MRRVVAIEDALPGGGPRRRLGLSELAELYERWGRPAEAEPLWRRLVELAAQEGRARPPSVDPVALLADNLVLQGRHAEAEPLRRRALVAGDAWLAGSRARMTDPKFAPTVRLLEAMHDEQRAHQLHRLGDTLAALGRRAAAERCYGEALDLLARPTASEADPDFPLGGPGHRERSRAARRRQAADVLRAAAGLAHGSGHSGRAVALDAQVAAAEDEATTLDRAARERLAMPNESHGLGNFLARE
jgi:tetratricopeptide (TPR) repeat protein